jgi:hypothetical protein
MLGVFIFPGRRIIFFAGLRSSRYFPFRGSVFAWKRAVNFAGLSQVYVQALRWPLDAVVARLRIAFPQLLSTYEQVIAFWSLAERQWPFRLA